MPPLRPAERDRPGDENPVGDLQQPAEVRLHEPVPAGEHAAIAQRPRGQQQVLAGRVDRPAFRRVRLAVTDQAWKHDDRHAFEGLHEMRHGRGHPRLRRVGTRTAAAVVTVRDDLSRPLRSGSPADQGSGRQRARAVTQHKEAEGLAVRTAGRAGCREQHGGERVLTDRLRAEPADGPGGGDSLKQADSLFGWDHGATAPAGGGT